MKYSKEQVTAIVQNIVQYSIQDFLGIEMPFSELTENLKDWNIDDRMITTINCALHNTTDCCGNPIIPFTQR